MPTLALAAAPRLAHWGTCQPCPGAAPPTGPNQPPPRRCTRWDASGAHPVCEASLEGHIDWVNDLSVVGDCLASCSSDTTVKVWRQQGGGGTACTHTFMQHSDYATRLASPAHQPHQLLSAGLRGQMFVYDLQVGGPCWRWGLGRRAGALAGDGWAGGGVPWCLGWGAQLA